MKTYPIYEALFLGSDDCMCHSKVRMAANNRREALRKFKAKQDSRSNTLGAVGRWSEEYKTHVRDPNAVTLVREIRATSINFTDYNYHL